MTSEVKATQKEMETNYKALGIDNLTSDVMILGGDESVKQITNFFNHILETKKIPVEWKKPR